MKRKLIFAGSYHQALRYARENNLGPAQYSVVSDPHHVLGLIPDAWEVVRVGTWYANEDVAKSYDYLRQHPLWQEATV